MGPRLAQATRDQQVVEAPSFIKERPYTAIGPPHHAGALDISDFFWLINNFFQEQKKIGAPSGPPKILVSQLRHPATPKKRHCFYFMEMYIPK